MYVDNVLDIRLSQMRLFLLVCDCKSFTAASKRLYTTQSAVSKSIASLERELGFALFERGGGTLEPTPAGVVLLKRWGQIIENIEASVNEATAMAENGRGTIRIGLSDSVKADMPYDRFIDDFVSGCTESDFLFLEYPTGELVGRLASGELDAIFTIDYEVPTLERLGKKWKSVVDGLHIQISMHESNPLAQRESATVDDLRDQKFIAIDPATHQTYIELIYRVCRERGFEPQFSIIAPNVRSAVATMIRTHEGILLGNRYIYDGENPHIRSIELQDTSSRMILAYGDDENPLMREFIHALSAHSEGTNRTV